jgi:hypothetical protein
MSFLDDDVVCLLVSAFEVECGGAGACVLVVV